MGAEKRKGADISRDNHEEEVLPGVDHDNDVQADARDDPTRLHDHRGGNQEEDAQGNQAEDARWPHRTHAQAHTSDDAGRLHDQRGVQRPDNQEIQAGIARALQAGIARARQEYAGASDHLDLGQSQPADDHESSDGEFSRELEETIEEARQVYNDITRAIWRVGVLRCGGCMRCAICVDDGDAQWPFDRQHGSIPE